MHEGPPLLVTHSFRDYPRLPEGLWFPYDARREALHNTLVFIDAV